MSTVEAIAEMLQGRRFVALTGAGCSTESGIPDYRGPGKETQTRKPIMHDAFVRRPEVRQRYWARATLGWARFAGAEPNAAHRALAALEGGGGLAGLITQNVDRLHHRAGSRRVVELHGALADVLCLACQRRYSRAELQERLLAANPGWLDQAAVAMAPDGDAELSAEAISSFVVIDCHCGGMLKPDVVFFGAGVPPETTSAAWTLFEEAQALLVVGSSLTVWSGYRFVRRAAERGIPIALVNLGPTRADDLVNARVDEAAGQVLPRLASRLMPR
jgi:NAD-dependent deacetylase sirtuin 4